jgi:hypothetical protein
MPRADLWFAFEMCSAIINLRPHNPQTDHLPSFVMVLL